jgi:hypothetical protein
VLDDVIGENTIADSLMPKVRKWLGSTVRPVLNPGGRMWVTGTHWDDDDIYMDMRKSDRDYDCRVRACYEKDGEPDWNGQPVLLKRREIEQIRRDPNMNSFLFSCQYMLDPLPAGERRWQKGEEQGCTVKEAGGPGVVFVLSDPAPAGISLRGEKDKQRGESGKDWWSLAVVKIRVRTDYQEIILLHGEHGQTWGLSEGHARACKLLQRFGTRYFFNESYSGDSWTDDFLSVARSMGVRPYLEKREGHWKLPKYKDSYSKNQKNLRFGELCDRNNRGEFVICDSVPDDFLYGDRNHTGFLTQMRKWMPLQNGRNNLKWDDDGDVVARATDSGLQKFAPKTEFAGSVAINSPAWWRQQEDQPDYTWGTRHVRV